MVDKQASIFVKKDAEKWPLLRHGKRRAVRTFLMSELRVIRNFLLTFVDCLFISC
jgi:hypothetical protein